MGISLKSLSEGCCEYLESLGCINLDKEKLVNCFNFKKEEIKISIA